MPQLFPHCATRMMKLSISPRLAELTKGTSVTMNSVLPGSTKTEGVGKFVQDIFPDETAEAAGRRFRRGNRPTSLLERLIDPQEISEHPGPSRSFGLQPLRGLSCPSGGSAGIPSCVP